MYTPLYPQSQTLERTRTFYVGLALLLLLIVLVPHAANASEGAGGGLPYEDWLTKLRHSVTGPYAYASSVIGVVVSGSILIFGGDLNGFFRAGVLIVLVLALIIAAENFISSLTGRGAEIAMVADVVVAHIANLPAFANARVG